MSSKKIFFIIRVFIGGAITFVLFTAVPYRELISVYLSSHKPGLFAGFLFIFSGHVIGALRWRFVLKAMDVRISVKESLYIFFSATFFVLVFPSFLASDAFRSIALTKRLGGGAKAVPSIIVDRFSGMAALAGISVFSWLGGMNMPGTTVFWPAVLFIVIVAASSLLFIFSPLQENLAAKLLRNKGGDFVRNLSWIRTRPDVFFKTVIYFSLPMQLVTVLSFFCVGSSFGLTLSLLHYLILVPLVMVVTCLPITVAGLGTRDLATVYFFSILGVAKSTSLGMSLLNLVFMIGVGLFGGIVYVMVYHRWMERGLPD